MIKFGILLYPSYRAKFYLETLIGNKILPAFTILLKGDGEFFAQSEDLLKKNKLEYGVAETEDINDNSVKQLLKKRPEEYFIFTGGGILTKDVVKLKKFIHVHSGVLPEYKGSTCVYFSMLKENFCGATAFIMNPDIDRGDIIAKKKFNVPTTRDVDLYYDSKIRADLLVEVLKDNLLDKAKKQEPAGDMYYIIHPVLKHIALLSIPE